MEVGRGPAAAPQSRGEALSVQGGATERRGSVGSEQGAVGGKIHAAGTEASALRTEPLGALKNTTHMRNSSHGHPQAPMGTPGVCFCPVPVPHLEGSVAGLVQVVERGGSLHAARKQRRGGVSSCPTPVGGTLPPWDPYLVFLGSRGPLPCSFLTNISLLLRITSRIFPRELLRWRVPLPSWRRRHKPGAGAERRRGGAVAR